MPEIFRAARLAPMTPGLPLIEDGAVAVHDGHVLEAGSFAAVRRTHQGPVRDLGEVTLAPATFNAHVHLEMSHLLGLTTSGQGFFEWIKSLLAQPLYDLDSARVRAELFRMEGRGTAFLADISTRNAAQVGQILAGSGLSFVSFSEVIGTNVPEDPASLLPQVYEADQCGQGLMSLAGHALYSTSGELLRAAKGLCRERGLPFSLHLAEHEDEDAILLTGKSPFLDLLQSRGYMAGFTAPGQRPAPLAESLGLFDADTLLVHCVRLDDEDIKSIAASGATVCLCPRSNDYIGVGRAPAEKLLAAGVNVCLGTDGLCSNADLDPYGELARLYEQGLGLGLCQGLALLTLNPARFFGRTVPAASRLGSLAAGNMARFSIVPDPIVQMAAQR